MKTISVALALAGLSLLAAAQSPSASVRVHRPTRAPEVDGWRATLKEGRPALRGFRAPLLEAAHEAWPIEMPSGAPEDAEVRAAELVARRLARDGLLFTLAQAIEILGPERVSARPLDADRLHQSHAGPDDVASAADMPLLRAIGLPVDMLEFFGYAPSGPAIVQRIARAIADGRSAAELQAELAAAPFVFRASQPGFRVFTECGEHDIGSLRMQVASGSYWQGVGDGGSLDMARQLVEALPGVAFVVSVEEKHLAGLLESARAWPVEKSGGLLVIPEPLPVAQWAQDNGKPGRVDGSAGDVTLAPRFASRGEDGSIFVPGETFAIESLSSAGFAVVQSPLLFQAGNLMAVRDPATSARTLLVGEAEVYRNIALGLSFQQVLDAFRAEFGIERCVVLPAVSFHIDYEVTVRSSPHGVVAFVNDSARAVQLVLACGLDALAKGGVISSAAALDARGDLDAGRVDEFMDTVGAALSSGGKGFGHFSESLAGSFSAGPADSGVGNLQRFLMAVDILTAHVMGNGELPFDPHTSAYLTSYLRRDADRLALVQGLESLGWRVVAVPSLSEGDRSLNYLNGVQERSRYLMPAYGGLYAPLDEAAKSAFAAALDPAIRVVPILSGESQRRSGAIHCSVAVTPRR